MKAIQFEQFGGTENLQEAEVEVPQPGPGQVRVRVRAGGSERPGREDPLGRAGGGFPNAVARHSRL